MTILRPVVEQFIFFNELFMQIKSVAHIVWGSTYTDNVWTYLRTKLERTYITARLLNILVSGIKLYYESLLQISVFFRGTKEFIFSNNLEICYKEG